MGSPGPQLEFRVLGPLEVAADGMPLPLGGPKQRALLAALTISAGRVVSADRLIEDLWGASAPKNATTSLHVYVSNLRKVLEPGRERGSAATVLVSQAPGYLLAIEPDALDLAAFEGLAARGRQELAAGDVATAAATLTAALGLWRGPALADFAYEPFAQSEIARLEELRLACTEDRIDADLGCGHHDRIVAELELLTRAHPLRERLHGQLMLALYRAGRQAEALAVYAATRERLVDELGIDPGPALQELNRAVLNQDAALAAPARPTPARPPEPAPRPDPAPAPARAEAPASDPRESRRVVTMLYTVLDGEDELVERVDLEVAERVLRRFRDAVREAVEQHGGTVDPAGDGRLGIFGVPAANEDDALRALRAAGRIRGAVEAIAHDLEPRIGVRLALRAATDTGEVIVDGRGAATGAVARTASALAHAAQAGETLLTETTRRLVPAGADVERVGMVVLPGRSGPIEAWRLLALVDGAPAFARQLETPLVGRERELDHLEAALAHARREETLVLFNLFGSAGVGKSRLVHELVTRVEADAHVLVGRCLAYGETITYVPVLELVRQATNGDPETLSVLLAGDPDASAVLTDLLSRTDADAEAGDVAAALRSLLEALAADRPVVVVVDDVHWAEPILLDLLGEVAATVRDVPVLLLCVARPELLEERPSWAGGMLNLFSVVLEPLGPDATEAMIDALPGGAAIDARLRARVADAAEGNPLFIEQMVALLAEDGWSGDVEVPPTIQAILAARLDRLGPAERAVIERGALVGREHRLDAVEALSPDDLRPSLRQHLESLARKELLRRVRPSQPTLPTFRFRHSLIQDAAYRAMAKEQRAELHERHAEWLDRPGEDPAAEILGFHLERAYGYRAELGLVGERTEKLRRRASDRLLHAGGSAVARGDVAGAVRLLERAVALDGRETVEPLVSLAGALHAAGELDRASSALADAERVATATGDRRALAGIRLDLLEIRSLVDPGFGLEEMQAGAEEALGIFEEVGDELGVARAWRAVAEVHLTRCHWEASAEALERAIEHAGHTGGMAELAPARITLASALYYGPTPVPQARARCEELLSHEPRHPVVEANVLCYLGGLSALEGDFTAARDLLGRGRGIFEELGHAVGAAGCSTVSGPVELLAGDPVAAELELRGGYDAFAAMGETGILSTLAAMLAESLLAQGRDAEAEELTRTSEELSATDDAASQIAWRIVRAEAFARRGDLESATGLIADAVALAAETDFLVLHARALGAQASILAMAGSQADAVRARGSASSLLAQKGARIATD